MLRRYSKRESRLYRWLRPPLPLIHNAKEVHLPSCSGTKLFIGGAGGEIPPGFLNVDIAAMKGVDIACDVEALPFRNNSIAAIECDAVLEHVKRPSTAISELFRVLQPGGFLHVVVPFCHYFHSYPSDYNRWTTEGLGELLADFEILNVGVRTGPTATLLALLLEYIKLWSPRSLRRVVYGFCAWTLWPLRYLDLWWNKRPEAHVLANHVYALARKPHKPFQDRFFEPGFRH